MCIAVLGEKIVVHHPPTDRVGRRWLGNIFARLGLNEGNVLGDDRRWAYASINASGDYDQRDQHQQDQGGGSSFVYRDRTGRTPLDHVEENRKVVLLFRHSEKQVGWKFRCTASVHREGPIYDDSIKRLFDSGLITDPESKTAAVVLQVDQVLTLFGEVLQEREPGLEW